MNPITIREMRVSDMYVMPNDERFVRFLEDKSMGWTEVPFKTMRLNVNEILNNGKA